MPKPGLVKAYVALLGLLFLALIVQFYLAAVGAFDKPHDDASFVLHRMNGMFVIPALSVIATVIAAFARVPKRMIGLTIVPVVLVVLQMVISVIAESFNTANGDTSAASVAVFGFHAVNGMLIMLLVRSVFLRARALMRGTRPAVATTDTADERAAQSAPTTLG